MRPLFMCLWLLGISAGIAHAKPIKLAILGIEAVDEGDVSSQEKTAAVAKSFTDALRSRAALLQSKGYSIPPNSNRELTEVKILSNCLDESVGCMNGIGKELGADKLLYGKLDKGKGGYTLTIKLLSVGAKSVDKSKSITISASDATNESVVRERAAQVFSDATGTEIASGSLAVKANVESGSVLVGGERKGTLVGGVAKINDLPEGSILVVVQADGYQPAEQEVTISSGKEAHAELTLEPMAVETKPIDEGDKPGAPSNTWMIVGWSAIGVSAVSFVFASYAWWGKTADLEDQASRNADGMGQAGDDPCMFEVNKSVCANGEKWADRSTYALVSGIVAGVGGGLILIFKAYAGESPSESSARTTHRFALDPYVGPGRAGMNATITF